MSSTSQQPTDPTATLVLGGRYRLMRRIGSGGMGVVWSAWDESLRRSVAVKELHHAPGSSQRTVADGRERSLREARAAAALHHPNIVAVYDIVEHDGRPWIVMELVSGRSLKEAVTDDGPLPVDRALGIGLKLLSALQAAHAAGITHRDVKPANVLVAADDMVWLTDFGLATMHDAETLTETGVVLGTPGYLAPEQAKGLTPGPPADMFGLAATLYYAIEGVGPFHRDGYLPMLVAYARHDIRPPQRAGPLAPVLLRLLAADPAKRPTAEQAREMLLTGAVRRSGPSRRLLLTGGAAAAVLAAGGIGLWSSRRFTPGGGSAGAGLPSVTESSAPPASSPPAQSPRRLGVGARAWHRDDLRRPVPVGSVLVGWNAAGVLAVDPETGKERWRSGPAGVWSVAPVGESLVFVAGPDGARVLDARTGAVRARHAAMHGPGGGVAGLFLSVSAGQAASALVGFDPLTGRERWRVRAGGPFNSEHFSAASGLVCAHLQRSDAEAWLYGIRPETGALAWKTRLTTTGVAKGHWGVGERVYVTLIETGQWTLVGVDASSGARRWALPVAGYDGDALESPIRLAGVAAVGGLIVATVRDDRLTTRHAGLTAVDPVTGAVSWRRPLLNPGVAAVSGQRLLVGSYDSVLHELDPATGATLWSTATAGPVDRLTVGSTMLFATIGDGATAYPLRRG